MQTNHILWGSMRHSLLIFSSILIAMPALAADPGTYRHGQAYHATPSANSDQCALQCRGDAQCKGWNFIKPQPNMQSGLCEFNSLRVSPVPSAISISGDNVTARSYNASIIPAGSNTVRIGQTRSGRTTRVGTAPVSHAPVSTRAVSQAPTRRIVRQAAPERIQPQTASYRPPQTSPSLTEQQNQYRRGAARTAPIQRRNAPQAPRFKHSLESSPLYQTRPISRPSPAVRQPRLTHNLDAGQVQPQRSVQHPPAQAPAPARHVAQRTAVPIPSQNRAPTPQRPSAPVALPRPIPRSPISTAKAQDSLFGSLHDDVSVPLSLTPDIIPEDPDAPIPTVASVPTIKVLEEKLGSLAGGPAN